MKNVQIYPTNIFYENITNTLNNQSLIDEIYNLFEATSDGLNSASVRFGWQSNKDLYAQSVFHPLCDLILKKFIDCSLIDFNKYTPSITALWANAQGLHGFNYAHIHAGAWYSGVYFLNCTKSTGAIKFLDPRPGSEQSYPRTSNNDIFCYKPNIGDLILFPAWLPHLVEPNLDKQQQRISLAFNIELFEANQ